MSRKNKSGKTGKSADNVVQIGAVGDRSDARRDEQREAKAQNLQKRFSAARKAAESPGKAAERLKKLFKPSNPEPRK